MGIILSIATSALLYYLNYELVIVISIPISITSLFIAIRSSYISEQSDKKMQAIANLDFEEKRAMVAGYVSEELGNLKQIQNLKET